MTRWLCANGVHVENYGGLKISVHLTSVPPYVAFLAVIQCACQLK